jgi:carbon storage regulator
VAGAKTCTIVQPSRFKEVTTVLVLSRKPGEQIRVGERITITVLEVQGSRIRVGIEAPAECVVLRGELCDVVPRPGEKPETV